MLVFKFQLRKRTLQSNLKMLKQLLYNYFIFLRILFLSLFPFQNAMRILLRIFYVFSVGNCVLWPLNQDIVSNVTEGLCAIIKALETSQLVILVKNSRNSNDISDLSKYCFNCKDFSDFVRIINQNDIQNVIFTEQEDYFTYIEDNVYGSIKVVSMIFDLPYRLSKILHFRKLAHRLSLFVFYYGENQEPRNNIELREPLRLAIITRRKNV